MRQGVANGSVLVWVVLLAGCSVFQMKKEPSERAWEARRAQLSQIDRFVLQARVSSGGLLPVKGNLNWKQQRDDFEMRVAGPFGVGAATIIGRGGTVEIRSSKGVFTTQNPEQDLHDRLGWTFPVSHLRYWALGLPAPGSDVEMELDDGGRITTLAQDDWTLEYDEYQDAGALELPRKFAVANAEVKIKVVVDDWSDLPVTQ